MRVIVPSFTTPRGKLEEPSQAPSPTRKITLGCVQSMFQIRLCFLLILSALIFEARSRDCFAVFCMHLF